MAKSRFTIFWVNLMNSNFFQKKTALNFTSVRYGPSFNPIIVLLNSRLIVCKVLIFTEKYFWGLFGTFSELSQQSPEKWSEDGICKVSFELSHRTYCKICIKLSDLRWFFSGIVETKIKVVEWRKDVMYMGSTAKLKPTFLTHERIFQVQIYKKGAHKVSFDPEHWK